MTAPMVVKGAMTGEMFLAYIEQCLVPTLKRNDIVVMDNCRVHLAPGIREAIERARATLRYLPKYSPDLNPIEMPYSKFKAFLRKVAVRTVSGLNRAIRSFIPQLSPQECANYFRHAGYVNSGPKLVENQRFEIAARPHLAVDLLVANLSGTPCPVKAAAAEGGGQRPAFTGHGVPPNLAMGSTPKRHTIGQFQTAGFR